MPMRGRSETDDCMVSEKINAKCAPQKNNEPPSNTTSPIPHIHLYESMNVKSEMTTRFHGREEVKEGGRYHMTLENDQKLYHMARLEITKVITGDKGEYRAVARNKHGEGVATINLNFEGSGKPKYEHINEFCKCIV